MHGGLLGGCALEPAKTTHSVVVIHDWLLLQSCEHVHLRLLLLLHWLLCLSTTEGAKAAIILRGLRLLSAARVKSSLPLVGPLVLLLLHAIKLSAHAAEGRLLLLGLLLLLQGAIEELGLEAARARGCLLVRHVGEHILWLLLGRLLLLLLLKHLHLIHLGLALLHWIVPVAHDLECRVLSV